MLGKTGMNVTVLGYGGAEIGYRGVPEETVERLINGALDAGSVLPEGPRHQGRRRSELPFATPAGQFGNGMS